MDTMNVVTSKVVPSTAKRTNVRWIVIAILFFVTIINYADRATIALAGPEIAKDLHMDAVAMGYIFSAFGWAYVLCQLPGGYLLDRFGSKKYMPVVFFSGLYLPYFKVSLAF